MPEYELTLRIKADDIHCAARRLIEITRYLEPKEVVQTDQKVAEVLPDGSLGKPVEIKSRVIAYVTKDHRILSASGEEVYRET